MSRSGYYNYLKKHSENKIDPDFQLIAKVREIHSQTDRTYGSRRMSNELRKAGNNIGRYRAASLMKKANVSVKHRKRFKITTDSHHKLSVAPNLLGRRFKVQKPNTVWCADITYLWTMQGWLYLAVIIDLYSRKVVGWSMSNRIKSALVEQALCMAYLHRNPGEGIIHHSDRGSQYAGKAYQKLLKSYGMVCSMSRKGDCWDNAVVESFFRTLKTERTNRYLYRTREEARMAVIDYIEMFYNSRRLHSSIGYNSPNDFEKEQIMLQAA